MITAKRTGLGPAGLFPKVGTTTEQLSSWAGRSAELPAGETKVSGSQTTASAIAGCIDARKGQPLIPLHVQRCKHTRHCRYHTGQRLRAIPRLMQISTHVVCVCNNPGFGRAPGTVLALLAVYHNALPSIFRIRKIDQTNHQHEQRARLACRASPEFRPNK